MSWEQQVVDEIIAAEKRIDEIKRELDIIEQRLEEGWLSDEGFAHFNQEFEELTSELFDLQKVFGNE